jgi:hypothetical protein
MIRSQYFKASYSKTIYKWCNDFFNEFSVSPQSHIKDLYLNNKLSIQDDEENDNIALLLKSLSKNYEETENTNVDFEIMQCVNYLKLRSGELLKEQLEDALATNDSKKIESIVTNYKRVEKPSGQGVDLLKDTEKVKTALLNEKDTLFRFPGTLGELIGPINRGDFACFFGPAGRGKSQWLWYTSETAMKEGCKVLLFTLEMTENEILKNRAWPSISGYPKINKTIYSAKFEENEDGKYSIEQVEKYKEAPNIDDIEKIQKKLRRLYRKGSIKIIFPTDMLTVEDIDSTLNNLYYYEDYVPDIVVIDYADYMAPSRGFKSNEYRQTINNIWKGLAALRLKKNIAIITASHTEVKTFNTDIKIEHSSEDKRKNNHISIGIALNQTEKEQDENVMRVAMTKMREGRKTSNQAVCLQCLDLGRPCIDSKMRKDVVGYENKNEEKREYKRRNLKDDI